MSTSAKSSELFGHPKGLYVCFLTEMWERFSFYGMKALLLLYITKYHLFSDDHGLDLLGAYGGLVYAMPVLGGLLADRYLGMRKAVIFGAVLLCLGHLGMAYEGAAAQKINGVVVQDTQALKVFYLSLSLIIVGVGFLKPNISVIVGKLYPDGDPRRESGFSIYYAGINIGALFASLFAAYIGEKWGWRFGFGIAGIFMLAGLLVFILGQKYLLGAAEAPNPAQLRQPFIAGLSREWLIYLSGFLGVGLVWLIIQQHSIAYTLFSVLPPLSPVLWTMHAITAVLVAGITWFMVFKCTPIQRQQMAVLIVIMFAGLVFFTLYEQTYGAWVLFSDRVMNRHFIIDWTAGQLTFLGALFIVLLSPLFAWLWPALERKNINPSKPLKTALGLLFAAFAFGVLSLSTTYLDDNGLAGFWWFVLAYLLLEIGEMLLSPISLAAVTALSVPNVVSVMMGGWFLGTSYAEVLAAELGKLSSITIPDGEVLNIAEALSKYDQLFQYSMWVGFIAFAVMLMLTPILKRGMHGVK